MLKMLLVFCHGCSANQLSAVEDESFERSKRGRALVGFPAVVVPNLTSGREKGYYYKSEGMGNNF